VQTADRLPKIARLGSQVSIAIRRIQLAGSGEVCEVVAASVDKFSAERLFCIWRLPSDVVALGTNQRLSRIGKSDSGRNAQFRSSDKIQI
jgi:hypothetical protein